MCVLGNGVAINRFAERKHGYTLRFLSSLIEEVLDDGWQSLMEEHSQELLGGSVMAPPEHGLVFEINLKARIMNNNVQEALGLPDAHHGGHKLIPAVPPSRGRICWLDEPARKIDF